MGNTITLIGNAFLTMKNNILGFILDLGVYVIELMIGILDAFWKSTRSFLVKCRDRIEQCRPSERRAITKAMAESAEVMNEDLKQRLQNAGEISPETQRVIGSYVDEYTEDMNRFAAAA